MNALQWLTALTPILAVAVLLVGLRMPASVAMPISLALTMVLAILSWGVELPYIWASIIEGLVIAAGVLLIVFGAIGLVTAMRESGGLDGVRAQFVRLSADSRVQLFVVGWMFTCFIEGASGFGTPGPVVAPLLMTLGFPAMAAASIVLAADVSAVTWGAVGTPLIVGVGQGLDLPSGTDDTIAELKTIMLTAAGMDIVVGALIPTILVIMLVGFGPKTEGVSKWEPVKEVLPLALVAAWGFSVPAFFWTWLLGLEFGGMLGAVTGLLLLITMIRRGVFVPKRTWTVTDGYVDADTVAARAFANPAADDKPRLSAGRIWGPYIVLTVLLLISRLIPPVKEALLSVSFKVTDVFGTNVSESLEPLYSPGFMFILTIAATAVLQRLSFAQVRLVVGQTSKAIVGTAITLAASVPMVRIFLNSDVNSTGLDKMPIELAQAASEAVGAGWPAVAPLVGALGAFVSGSATFSNLMFSQLQVNVAQNTGLNTTVTLAQQVSGANAGNMVCVMNVVSVASVAGLLGREGEIISRTVKPMTYYVVGIGAMGFLLNALL